MMIPPGRIIESRAQSQMKMLPRLNSGRLGPHHFGLV
jgi:hypothetical protein